MKALARAILARLLPRLPDHRREYGHAMLGELEELEGWAAIQWALGGVPLLMETMGGTMKNALYWIGLIAVAGFAGWVHLEPDRWRLAMVVLAVSVGVFAFWRPKQAVPAAILIASSLPLAHLITVYVSATRLAQVMTGGLSFSGTLSNVSGKLTSVVNVAGNSSDRVVYIDGALRADETQLLLMPLSTLFDTSLKSLSQAPSVERLLAYTATLAALALVVALVIATVKTRFARAKPA